jgi:hypothetical protein
MVLDITFMTVEIYNADEIIQNRIIYGTHNFSEWTQIGQLKNFNLQTGWSQKGRTSEKIIIINNIYVFMYITLNLSDKYYILNRDSNYLTLWICNLL